MKKFVFTVVCSFLLVGCGPRQSQTKSSVGFVAGATREDVVLRLEQIHAAILTNTPELMRAEFQTPELKKPMQVELAFRDGNLASVNYIPQ